MEQRISIITLGVRDLSTARAFYDALGWQNVSPQDESVIAYDLNGMTLGLYQWDALAEDAKVSSQGSGFRGVSIAYNVRTKEEVSEVLREVERAGGRIVKPAEDVFWGGHSGYFADPDGHLWEVAFNPFAPLGPNGEFQWNGVEDK